MESDCNDVLSTHGVMVDILSYDCHYIDLHYYVLVELMDTLFVVGHTNSHVG